MRQERGVVKFPVAAPSTKKSGAPALFLCPISLEIMRDPVIVCTGQTYDRQSIEKWIKDGHRSCPITMLQLHDLTLIPNIIVRQLIEAWSTADDSAAAMFPIDGNDRSTADSSRECEMWPSPVSQADFPDGGGGNREQVLCLLRIIAGGGGNVGNAVSRLRSMASRKDDEQDEISSRNACDCIVEAGGALLLASLLADRSYCCCDEEDSDRSSRDSTEDSTTSTEATSSSCEEVLALLGIICRGPNARAVADAVMEESGAVDAVISHLKGKRPIPAAMLLKRMLAASEEMRAIAGKTPGFFRALLDLMDAGGGGSGVGGAATKSLVKLLHLAIAHKPSRGRAVEQGAVATLVALLGGGATGGAATCERCLAALEALCGVEAGRRAAAVVAVPTVVRMLLGHSRQCTEHSTACLLLLCQSGPVEILQTAVRAGAGRQLLLLLQSDCTGRAKRKALELLKLFHAICEPGMRISSSDSSKNGADVLY